MRNQDTRKEGCQPALTEGRLVHNILWIYSQKLDYSFLAMILTERTRRFSHRYQNEVKIKIPTCSRSSLSVANCLQNRLKVELNSHR